MGAASLLNLIVRNCCRSVAFIGMAKNAGKTVAFNHVIQEATQAGFTLGLTSVGRDGEIKDALTGLPKPRIFVSPGMLVATADQTLAHSDAGVRVVETTGCVTPLGEVVIGAVEQPGYIELAGPGLCRDLPGIIRRLNGRGANLVLVDGAFDRHSLAAPTLTDGAVLATGAALDPRMEAVLERTLHRVRTMALPVAEPAMMGLAEQVIREHRIGLVNHGGSLEYLDVSTLLGSEALLAACIKPDTAAAIVSGAVVNATLEALMARQSARSMPLLIIKDSTCLFVDLPVWRRFMQNGGRVAVLFPVRLLAVTVNPVCPGGWRFDPGEFLARAGTLLSPLPVLDLVRGDGCNLDATKPAVRSNGTKEAIIWANSRLNRQ